MSPGERVSRGPGVRLRAVLSVASASLEFHWGPRPRSALCPPVAQLQVLLQMAARPGAQPQSGFGFSFSGDGSVAGWAGPRGIESSGGGALPAHRLSPRP